MGVIIDGSDESIPGLVVTNWRQTGGPPRLKKGEDCRDRFTRWVRGIVLHTTKGIPGGSDHRPQVIKPGAGPDRKGDYAVARFWATSTKQAGAHLVVDFDGSVVCLADLLSEVSFHAGEVNEVTIGIEIYQGNDAELYEGQLDAVVQLVDFLTRRFRIQRQIHGPYQGKPAPRMAQGGVDVVGIYGHRDVTTNRGSGDPGDAVFQRLAAAGYESFDFAVDQDRAAWRQRQETLNNDLGLGLDVDGVPGQKTVAALIASGRPHGLWVTRPGDDPAVPSDGMEPRRPRAAASRASTVSALDAVDQFVIVMMENRSFDHMLGYWNLPPWNQDRAREPIDGVQLDFNCPGADGLPRLPFELTADDLDRAHSDLPHSRGSTWRQMARDGADHTLFRMNGFVKESFPSGPTPSRPPCMGYLTPPFIPMTHMLSTEFTICDRWFTPIPTDTHPNRMFAIAGWTPFDETHGELVDASPTVLDFLLARGIDLRIYARRLSFLALSTSTISHARQVLKPWGQLEAHWNEPWNGPRVTYIEPAYRDVGPVVPNPPADDDHPPTPVAYGQAFLREVYRIIRSNEDRWRRTMMIIVYDEHGGFADHVPPLAIDTPSPAAGLYPAFVCTGPRVPAILVSPWVRRLSRSRLNFDHTSILRTLADKFAPGEQRLFRQADQSGVDCVFRRPVSSLWPALDLADVRTDAPEIPDAPPLPPQPAATDSLLTKVFRFGAQQIIHALGALP